MKSEELANQYRIKSVFAYARNWNLTSGKTQLMLLIGAGKWRETSTHLHHIRHKGLLPINKRNFVEKCCTVCCGTYRY